MLSGAVNRDLDWQHAHVDKRRPQPARNDPDQPLPMDIFAYAMFGGIAIKRHDLVMFRQAPKGG